MTKVQRQLIYVLGYEYIQFEEVCSNLKIHPFDEILFVNEAKMINEIAFNIAPSYRIDLNSEFPHHCLILPFDL